MKVRLYGRLADIVGAELEIDGGSGCSIGQLRGRLIADVPAIRAKVLEKRVRACVNGVVVDDDYLPGPTDCVEFLAPVSGG